jgi:hypothetical protein
MSRKQEVNKVIKRHVAAIKLTITALEIEIVTAIENKNEVVLRELCDHMIQRLDAKGQMEAALTLPSFTAYGHLVDRYAQVERRQLKSDIIGAVLDELNPILYPKATA